MGKGSKQRPTNHAAFSENYDLIFGRATVDKLAEENGCAIERVRERMTLIEASRKEHALETYTEYQLALAAIGELVNVRNRRRRAI